MIEKKTTLEEIIRNHVEAEGFILYDLKIQPGKRNPLIRVYLDHEKGLTIDHCAQVTRTLMEEIDRSFWELENYRLEVSSPGLDRELTTPRDFQRNSGKMIVLTFNHNGEPEQIDGTIESANDEHVIIQSDDNLITVPIQQIMHAKIKLKW